MNWIKIIPDTVLPDGIELLVYNTANDCWFTALVDMDNRLFNLMSGSYYEFSKFTHYCIIEPPKD